jgi:hypothetical protein
MLGVALVAYVCGCSKPSPLAGTWTSVKVTRGEPEGANLPPFTTGDADLDEIIANSTVEPEPPAEPVPKPFTNAPSKPPDGEPSGTVYTFYPDNTLVMKRTVPDGPDFTYAGKYDLTDSTLVLVCQVVDIEDPTVPEIAKDYLLKVANRGMKPVRWTIQWISPNQFERVYDSSGSESVYEVFTKQ